MASNLEVECPICGSSFPSSKIEVHAEACIQASFSSNDDTQQQPGLKEKSAGPEIPSAGNKRKYEVVDGHQSASKSSPTNFTGNKGPASSSKKIRSDQAAAWSFLGKTGSTSKSNRDQSTPNAPQQSQESDRNTGVPLAEQMRPVTLDDYIGQESILSSNSFLKNLISKDSFINMILWGPPGCGKTSLANIIAKRCRGSEKWRYASLSACTSGVQDVKKVVQEAQSTLQLRKRRTVLFMDEVHRFNKAQQDIFLPHVESGLLTLVGATTENPSFTLNSALLSRCRVITLEALSVKNIRKILQRALKKLKIVVEMDESENGEESSTDEESEEEEEEPNGQEEDADTQEVKENSLKISWQALRWLSNMSGGDARCALNTLQTLVTSHSQGTIKIAEAKEALQRSHVLYDRKGEEHYNMASALQKSIRGGNDNAALYWTMRMVKGGEDPRFIARRLVRTAAEDIGLGDPQALNLAVSTMHAVQMLGMPESNVILCQCAVYLARAKHNPEVYLAMNRILQHMDTHTGPLPPVPLHLRNAPTKLMKDIGYGKGYTADPRFTRNIEYMPDALKDVNFFQNTG